MKKEIVVFEYAKEIMQAVQSAVLLTTKSGEHVNSMTISWGAMGIEWGKMLFVAFVRESRFTKQMLDENPEFTINIPLGEKGAEASAAQKKILAYCGVRSGRSTNKIADMNLHLESPLHISVPGIKELPLTLECRVLYTQKQELDALKGLNAEEKERLYPFDAAMGKEDVHTAFYGEIVGAYIIE